MLIKTILITNNRPKPSELSMKSYVLVFSHIRPCRKKVKVNQRSSLTTSVVLEYLMLHAKFQGHWSVGSGEEAFFT